MTDVPAGSPVPDGRVTLEPTGIALAEKPRGLAKYKVIWVPLATAVAVTVGLAVLVFATSGGTGNDVDTTSTAYHDGYDAGLILRSSATDVAAITQLCREAQFNAEYENGSWTPEQERDELAGCVAGAQDERTPR